jgi:hypothetical protein
LDDLAYDGTHCGTFGRIEGGHGGHFVHFVWRERARARRP